uniref:THAP-type domain-containing protein n=1 Tax=Globodera rostochiensis TaxID=31243 RepID=A0A914HE52_GLORO
MRCLSMSPSMPSEREEHFWPLEAKMGKGKMAKNIICCPFKQFEPNLRLCMNHFEPYRIVSDNPADNVNGASDNCRRTTPSTAKKLHKMLSRSTPC